MAGSIALDDLAGEFGRVQNELGGSALYFALAASLLHPVSLVAPVGRSEAETVRALLAPRPVDISGLSILEAPTYRWRARQEHGANLDLGSQDSIYDSWEPSLPSGFAGWAFVGSMRPDRQLQVARNLRAAAPLLAADAMHSYVSSAPEQALAVVDLCDWYFANEAELRALGGDPAAPDGFRRRHGLAGLVVKSGAAGVAVHTTSGGQRLGAPSVTVLDTTGAGDALAGGMLAGWCRSGGAEAGLELALVQGLAAAAVAISAVGLRGLVAASPALLAERVRASRPKPAES